MASSDAETGNANHTAHTRSRFWGKASVVGAVVVVSLLGWVVLWRLVSAHAALEGGYGALGPGMAMVDDLARLMGVNGIPQEGIWGDICRAFVSGGSTQSGTWPVTQYWIALGMWMVMALAMMLPTALPMIAAFGDIQYAAREKGLEDVPGWVFTAGYLVVWSGLAVVAAALQWEMINVFGEDPVFATSMPLVGGVLLILAGLYQWSALKAACLSQCRSPMRFFMTHWRNGRRGAFRMGLRHGVFCVGCCWALMALMFVGGTMNLVWMAVLTIIMLLEKVLPQKVLQQANHSASLDMDMARVFVHGTGIIFVVWGVVLLISGFIQIGLF
ncbi:MAG: DUF2182 domain-containing protein [Rhodospirillaceae bacterium]|nr:DUF2182 domain-containing protein [Rhodospirillaceae bacterium]